MRSTRPSRRARSGYTLIELMVIVMIIGMSVIAFAPGFSRAMADRNVSTATRELIRIGRRARSDTFGYLRAHLMWIQPASGRIQLLRGPTQSCTTPPWNTIQADCPNDLRQPSAQRCLENVSLPDWKGGNNIVVHEELVSGSAVTYSQTSRAICFAPSGQMFTAVNNALATAAANLNDANTVNGGIVFTLILGDRVPESVPPVEPPDLVHRVLFPFGSTPRAMR